MNWDSVTVFYNANDRRECWRDSTCIPPAPVNKTLLSKTLKKTRLKIPTLNLSFYQCITRSKREKDESQQGELQPNFQTHLQHPEPAALIQPWEEFKQNERESLCSLSKNSAAQKEVLVEVLIHKDPSFTPRSSWIWHSAIWAGQEWLTSSKDFKYMQTYIWLVETATEVIFYIINDILQFISDEKKTIKSFCPNLISYFTLSNVHTATCRWFKLAI